MLPTSSPLIPPDTVLKALQDKYENKHEKLFLGPLKKGKLLLWRSKPRSRT